MSCAARPTRPSRACCSRTWKTNGCTRSYFSHLFSLIWPKLDAESRAYFGGLLPASSGPSTPGTNGFTGAFWATSAGTRRLATVCWPRWPARATRSRACAAGAATRCRCWSAVACSARGAAHGVRSERSVGPGSGVWCSKQIDARHVGADGLRRALRVDDSSPIWGWSRGSAGLLFGRLRPTARAGWQSKRCQRAAGERHASGQGIPDRPDQREAL